MQLANYLGDVLEQRDLRRSFDAAPRAPVRGTSTVSMFDEKLQADLLCLGDLIALRVMGVFSKYSLLIPARSKGPQEVRDSFYGAWIGVLGRPKCTQMYEGGEREDEAWADLCSDRTIKLQFQGVRAPPWILWAPQRSCARTF